jgi:hypothetical protein
MTLAALKTKANTKLQAFWDILLPAQEAYRLKRDNYFQLLATNPVVDGEDTTFELRHHNGQIWQADVNFSFNSPIPFQIEVIDWGTKPSRGFKATATVELPDGRRFQRSRSYTDTRERVRDIVSGSLKTDDIVYSDWYLVGDDPVIVTSNWSELIEE